MKRPLRVLYLCSARQFVGEAARVVDLAETLIDRDHVAEIVVRKAHAVAEFCSRRCVPYLNAQMRSRFNPYHDFADIRLIRERIRSLRTDIVHAHRGKDHWLAAMALCGMRDAPPLVRTRHVVTPLKSHAANRWLFGKATSGLICVSKAVAAEVARTGPFVRCPVRTIGGGISEKRFSPVKEEQVALFRKRLHIPEDARIVSCLARLAPVKGQEYIFQAMPIVLDRHPKAVFLFAFPRQSDYRAKLDGIARSLRLSESLRFIGPPDHLNVFLAASDVGLLSSTGSEGWSRATVEFLYFGVPVVASRVGCLPELIHHGENGYLVHPRDPEELADAIIRLLDDAEARARMGARAAGDVRAHHTFSRTADQVVAFYRELLEMRA